MTTMKRLLCGAAFAGATLFTATAAHAGGNVFWSIGIHAPLDPYGASIGTTISNAPPAVVRPVVVQPAPVYYEPVPVVYHRPVVYQRPVVIRPAPVYVQHPPHRHHRHHDWKHRDRDDDRADRGPRRHRGRDD